MSDQENGGWLIAVWFIIRHWPNSDPKMEPLDQVTICCNNEVLSLIPHRGLLVNTWRMGS